MIKTTTPFPIKEISMWLFGEKTEIINCSIIVETKKHIIAYIGDSQFLVHFLASEKFEYQDFKEKDIKSAVSKLKYTTDTYVLGVSAMGSQSPLILIHNDILYKVYEILHDFERDFDSIMIDKVIDKRHKISNKLNEKEKEVESLKWEYDRTDKLLYWLNK